MSVIVSLAEAKLYLRLTTTSLDEHVQALLDGAEDWVSRQTGALLGVDTKTEYLDGGLNTLTPSYQPINSITSITDDYTGEAEAATDYRIRNRRIVYGGSGTAPQPWLEGPQRWEVVYVAGYTAELAPKGLKVAVMELVKRVYDAQGGITSQSIQDAKTDYDRLADGEIMALLEPFYMGSLV